MRTFFPPSTAESNPGKPLRRAALLTGVMAVIWVAIQLLPAQQALPTEFLADSQTTASPFSNVSDPSVAGIQESGTQEPGIKGSKVPTSLFGPGYLLVLMVLAVGGIWALWLRRQREHGDVESQGLHELARLRTGPQQNLHLIACGDEVLVIGATPTSVNLVKSYPAALFEKDAPVQAAMMDVGAFETPMAEHADMKSDLSDPHRHAAIPNGAVPYNAPDNTPDNASHNTPDNTSKNAPNAASAPFAPEDLPDWSVANASALDEPGPDFMTVLRRYTGSKSYKANKLYPTGSGTTPS